MKHQLLIVFLLGLSLFAVGVGAKATDISGTWAFSISLDGGPQNFPMTFILKQAGDKLTGTQGESQLTGTVKGNQVAITVAGKNKGGMDFKNIYNGTIESATKMSGTCEFPKGPGKWTATKK